MIGKSFQHSLEQFQRFFVIISEQIHLASSYFRESIWPAQLAGAVVMSWQMLLWVYSFFDVFNYGSWHL